MDGLINKVIVGNALTKLGILKTTHRYDCNITTLLNMLCMIKMLTLIAAI